REALASEALSAADTGLAVCAASGSAAKAVKARAAVKAFFIRLLLYKCYQDGGNTARQILCRPESARAALLPCRNAAPAAGGAKMQCASRRPIRRQSPPLVDATGATPPSAARPPRMSV